jgi:hypothetical protein
VTTFAERALTRRSLLLGGGAAAATLVAGQAVAERPPILREATEIAIEVRPLGRFSLADRDRRDFGALTFRSGLELRSRFEGFGGFSGLWRSPDGRDLVAVSDRAHWLTARVTTRGGELSGLADAVMAPMLSANGRPLATTRSYDTESLAMVGGVAYVGIERTHEVMRFDWARDGVKARGRSVPVPRAAKDLPSNRSFEAIGVAPAGSPVAGAVVVIAERSGGDRDPTLGFILTGSGAGSFEVIRSDDYDVTDLAFLPGGAMLILERRFSLWRGPAVRLRWIAGAELRAGARLDGPILFEANAGAEIDNMEGLALHHEAGQPILTLISDDNFSALQRTLLLEFALGQE